MRCERLGPGDDPAAVARALRDLVPGGESVRETVAEIIEAVRRYGDGAVLDYTRKLDTEGATPKSLRVGEDELDEAAERLDDELREALAEAVHNVASVADLMAPRSGKAQFDDHTVGLREYPVARAAVYVPGGRAPYPSTVVMGVVPALSAGVEEVFVCSPPGSDGEINQAVLGACRLAGATGAYRMGGAQAIAALAYGTESVRPVEVIVGPGNL